MSVVTELELEGRDIPLGRALAGSHGTRIEFEQVVPSDEDVLPWFWTECVDPDGFKSAARADDGIASLERVESQNGRSLYRIEWGDDCFVDSLRDTDATVLSAGGTATRWQFSLRCANHEELSRLQSRCLDRGIAIEPTRIQTATASTASSADHSRLTEKQREAVVLAVEEGYFAVPRRITLVELAEKLGVSDQAASERLRRGVGNLTRDALPIDDRPSTAESRVLSTD